MIVKYNISCYDRVLMIEYPNGYEQYENEIIEVLNDAYNMWTAPEYIEDEEEREYIESTCCEEFMIENLSEIYNQWDSWWTVDYETMTFNEEEE